MPIHTPLIAALSANLGCQPAEIAAVENPTDPDDARRLGALLADVGAPVHEQAIVDTFAWTPERVHAAANHLCRRLRPAGQTLLRGAANELELAAASHALTGQDHAAIRQSDRLELDDARVQVLDIVISGRLRERDWGNLEPDRHRAAGELIAAGLITEHSGELGVTDELRDAIDDDLLHRLEW